MALTLFENITEQLTDYEKKTLVPSLVAQLSKITKKQPVKGKKICQYFSAAGYTLTEPRLRKCINYIRVMNLLNPAVLIGTSEGYYTTESPEVVQAQIESLQGRIDSMSAVVDSLKAQKLSIERLKDDR